MREFKHEPNCQWEKTTSKDRLEETIKLEKKINKVLWKASNNWHNTHAENAEGYIGYLTTTIIKKLLGKRKGEL